MLVGGEQDELRVVFECAVTEEYRAQLVVRKDTILVRGENFKSALGKHSDEGYASLNNIHRLLGTNLDDSLIAPALTMHGHVNVEVDEDFELPSILKSERL